MEGKAYSPADISAWINLPDGKRFKLGTISMLSISTHRDKFPVTTLGKIKVVGFTGSHQTIGGTLVFNTLDRSVFYRLLSNQKRKVIEMGTPDMFPLFDITLSFVNEYGHSSFMGVLGVTILDSGQSFSIETPAFNETYSYMATTYLPLQPLGDV